MVSKMLKNSAEQGSINSSANHRYSSLPVTFSAHKPGLFAAQVSTDVSWLDRWLTRKMLDVVGNPPVRIILWDGVEASPCSKNPVAVLYYADRDALLKTMLDHERYWGDLYCMNRVRVEGDMTRFLEVMYNSYQAKDKTAYLEEVLRKLGKRRMSNSPDLARQNIHHHYDIGNEFYKLWLDREHMQYSCAYFPQENMTLEQAQTAKLHHICHKLQLKPGDRVLEAGCGWGGLSRFMVKNYGARVTAYNISSEQIHYAREHAEQEFLSDWLEYVQDDYRNIEGEFDVFVSVGMLEHVGTENYIELGRTIRRVLKTGGRGLIHSIGRVTQSPMNPWIERNIFPGAYPPSLSEMMQIFEPNELAVMDVENLRLHYSRTIQHWAERFEQHKSVICKMMDEPFVRAWSLYLYGSIAAFNVGSLQLFQVVFNPLHKNDLPRSRAYMYPQENNTGSTVETFESR